MECYIVTNGQLYSPNMPNEIAVLRPLHIIVWFHPLFSRGTSATDDDNLTARQNEHSIVHQNLVFVPWKVSTRCRLRRLVKMLQDGRFLKSSSDMVANLRSYQTLTDVDPHFYSSVEHAFCVPFFNFSSIFFLISISIFLSVLISMFLTLSSTLLNLSSLSRNFLLPLYFKFYFRKFYSDSNSVLHNRQFQSLYGVHSSVLRSVRSCQVFIFFISPCPAFIC